jgi:hypothetical protein
MSTPEEENVEFGEALRRGTIKLLDLGVGPRLIMNRPGPGRFIMV